MKARDLFIEQLAKKCPAQNFQSTYKTIITGEDAILAGNTEIGGKPIDPEKEYRLNCPIVLPVNHERRIRRAYKSNGREGVFQYMKKYIAAQDHGKLQLIINSQL